MLIFNYKELREKCTHCSVMCWLVVKKKRATQLMHCFQLPLFRMKEHIDLYKLKNKTVCDFPEFYPSHNISDYF